MPPRKTAIIIGAGPAGLTAAYELLTRTDIQPVIIEMSAEIGGISRTVNYKGNRIDIGGHRFFSKSGRVMEWWKNMLPVEDAKHPAPTELNRLLVRNRLSRIYYLRKFFAYPVTLSLDSVRNLGIFRMFKIGFSYLRIRLFPVRAEKNLEDFFTNRFGKELYKTFFRDYTEKVWGVPCKEIKPEWGVQRIKGISVSKVIAHAISRFFHFKKPTDLGQKETETSLIDKFLYPKHGPGQMWETAAAKILALGGEIIMNTEVVHIKTAAGVKKIESVTGKNSKTGKVTDYVGDYFLSTMPISGLVQGWHGEIPDNIKAIASDLKYRDFITVGLLLKKLKIRNKNGTSVKDNWIYIQEPEVKVGRLQIFNNWSPYLVKDPDTVWVGLEYFCNNGDELSSRTDEELKSLAATELDAIDIISSKDVLDAVVIRTPKAYPAYFGSYDRLDEVREFLDDFKNLFLIGRNGMHRYNNQDHSMLSAMAAVENIMSGSIGKANIWSVNAEDDYHEEDSALPKKKPVEAPSETISIPVITNTTLETGEAS